VPKRADVDAHVGGKDYVEEMDGGRVTLRLMPYDKTIHKLTPQRMFNCLRGLWDRQMAVETRESYLHSYLQSAVALQHGILRIVLSGAYALIDTKMLAGGAELVNATKILKIPPATSPAEKAKQRKRAVVSSRLDKAEVNGIQRAIMERVFQAYIASKQQELWKDRYANDAASGIGVYMVSCAKHVRIVLERVVGRALRGAAPGTDLDLSMCQPSRTGPVFLQNGAA